MDEHGAGGGGEALESQVARARNGDRAALESVVRSIQPDLYNLALRFLWHPEDAEDATQEILIRVLTGLGAFRQESSFRTWVYRIACNALLTLRKQRMEQSPLSFEGFGHDLESGLDAAALRSEEDPDQALLLEEVKIGCTLAMLQCLDRPHRLAYILGEILELDHNEAAAVLDISHPAYRKRLSRARARVSGFMTGHCGLADPANACRCHRRVGAAVALGRVDPSQLLFAGSRQQAKRFPRVLAEIRKLEESRRAAALYRSHPQAAPSTAFLSWLKGLLETGG